MKRSDLFGMCVGMLLWQPVAFAKVQLSVGAGLSVGFLGSTAEDLQFDETLWGPAFRGALTPSLLTEDFVFDLSLSWQYSRLSGDSIRENISTSVVNTTRSAVVSFHPKWRANSRWEFGPLAEVFVGAENPFGQAVDVNEPYPVTLGIAAFYRITPETSDTWVRVGLLAGTDITLPSRQLGYALVQFDVSVPLRFLGGRVEKEIQIEERVNFMLDDQLIHFEFNERKMSERSELFLRELAEQLKIHESLFGSLRIEGHTDSRGTLEYNDELSEGRAQTVRAVMLSAGLAEDKLEARGYGERQLIVTGETDADHAVNRRVELAFSEVTDAKKLREIITTVKMKHTR